MAEYIERSYIRKMAMFEMAYTMETETDAAVVLRMIDDAPAADVAPVVHGRWIHDGRRINGGIDWCHCSECGKSDNFCARTNYCPNCGAKMDGGDNDAVD
nr:MAG TPA: DNA-directed RNA polymerase [Caudoviricetes sp.]